VSDLPRITIITPCFDHTDFLNQTISSVLDQSYPNLEYLVVDGSNREESKRILEAYDDRLHWWCQQRFQNPAQAINKGLDKATGDIIAVLNCGDSYLPGTLQEVGEYFRNHPKTDFLYGQCQIIDQQGETLKTHRGNLFKLEELLDLWNVWWKGRNFLQPECFWSRRVFLKVRSFREDLDRAFVYEYWTRLFLSGANVERIDKELSRHRFPTGQSSAYSDVQAEEELAVIESVLWNPKARLDRSLRRRLQADWLYESQIAGLITDSATAGESLWQCRCKIAPQLLQNPKVLLSERFQARMREYAVEQQ
jgi:glycosyltransferase involved in cell wall biosynthesis